MPSSTVSSSTATGRRALACRPTTAVGGSVVCVGLVAGTRQGPYPREPIATDDRPLPGMPPRRQHPRARTRQPAGCQLELDHDPINRYRQHRCTPQLTRPSHRVHQDKGRASLRSRTRAPCPLTPARANPRPCSTPVTPTYPAMLNSRDAQHPQATSAGYQASSMVSPYRCLAASPDVPSSLPIFAHDSPSVRALRTASARSRSIRERW
jgi:hypothetical protein